MSSLKDLREKLQAKLNKTCVIVVVNSRAINTIKDCCASLKEHIKMKGDVEYFLMFEVPLYEQISSMGTEVDNKIVINDIPLLRVVTQCPPMFASRSTYWNMLNLIPKFREFDQGIMISSKVGLGIDITDDMISNGNSFAILNDIAITCTKDYTTGKYMKCCNENSCAYEYTEDDLPTYNSVVWGGNIVEMSKTIEEMIEKDLTTDILLANASYYFNKYMWSHKPTKVFKETEDFKNDISMCLDKHNAEITAINKKLNDYDTAHPEKEVKDKNVNSPLYENLPPVYLERVSYDDTAAIRVLNTDQDYVVILLSKSQKQPIIFIPHDQMPKTEETHVKTEKVAEETPVEKVAEDVKTEETPAEKVAEDVKTEKVAASER